MGELSAVKPSLLSESLRKIRDLDPQRVPEELNIQKAKPRDSFTDVASLKPKLNIPDFDYYQLADDDFRKSLGFDLKLPPIMPVGIFGDPDSFEPEWKFTPAATAEEKKKKDRREEKNPNSSAWVEIRVGPIPDPACNPFRTHSPCLGASYYSKGLTVGPAW